MAFVGKPLDIAKNTRKIPALLRKVRKIYDMPRPPKGLDGCGDCEALAELVALASIKAKD
jgi:hypothetical protein